MFFAHVAASGQIMSTGTCSDGSDIPLQTRDGCETRECSSDVGYATHYFGKTGDFETFPKKPSNLHEWDWPSLSWALPSDAIDRARRSRSDAVNAIRQIKLASGVTFGGHRYDSDDAALGNMTRTAASLAVTGILPDGFVWRDADNIDVPHTTDSFRALVAAVTDFGDAVYKRSFALKNQISLLESIEVISSLDIASGWPESS